MKRKYHRSSCLCEGSMRSRFFCFLHVLKQRVYLNMIEYKNPINQIRSIHKNRDLDFLIFMFSFQAFK
jgi:hypothetical protein